jgi:ferredoxin-type protein NapH
MGAKRPRTGLPTAKASRTKTLLLPGVCLVGFWTLGASLWHATGFVQPLLLFGYIGTVLGLGLGLYALLPRKKKQWGRRLTLLGVGGGLLAFMGLVQSENLQLEWLFLALLSGLGAGVVSHYLIAKVLGPVLIGRLWCGWGCWTLMVLDLLPYQRPPGRLSRKLEWLRYAHFVASFLLVFVLWSGFRYGDRLYYGSPTGLVWMLVGNALYYLVAVGMAVALKDNRAFCKYVCPVTVFLKATSRFAVLKIRGDMTRCNECEACEKMCPMDVRILDYIREGKRVLSTECMLCQTCVTVCAKDALKVSAGLDLGGQERLRRRGDRRSAA